MLALPHLGNWDFAGAWLALQGFTVTVVAEPVEPPELFEWFVETRARSGMRVIPLVADRPAPTCSRRCATTRWCACSPTATSPATASTVEFFGERTTLPGGPAMTALRAGAPLLPVGCYFMDHGDSRADIRAARHLPVPSTTARVAPAGCATTSRRVTQDLAHAFEELIRVEPTHWHLLQPNWPSDRGRAGGA